MQIHNLFKSMRHLKQQKQIYKINLIKVQSSKTITALFKQTGRKELDQDAEC